MTQRPRIAVPAKKADTPVAMPRPVRQPQPAMLPGGSIKDADFYMRRLCARIPVSHTLADVESPAYFRFYFDTFAKHCSQGPVKLEVISHDCSIHAEYLITEARRNFVRLRRLIVWHDETMEPAEPIAPPDERPLLQAGAENGTMRFTTKWGGPKEKHRILDYGLIVARNIPTSETRDEMLASLNDGSLSVSDIPTEFRPAEVE